MLRIPLLRICISKPILRDGKTSEAVDLALALAHSDKILSNLNFVATGNPGEQERLRKHSKEVFLEHYKSLIELSDDAPEMHSDYRFTKVLFDFAELLRGKG
jgi:hypothetical protein